jgi:peptidoglycan hydrolase-like protein with peptidoglycan-binding domain
LANLILASKDKSSKNGYGRDWQTTFIDLDEKRKSLDTSKGAFGEKDKKALDDLEGQVEKYRLEFIKASNAAIDKSLAAVDNDAELNGAYGDVNTLCDEAKGLKTRAESQYATALTVIKDEHKEKEEVFNKTLFPISKGNTDADDKFKDSGLIFAIQKALCDGIPAAGKLIKSKGGPNGKYGPATKSVIATIQKMEGNKNVNGEIDQALLSDILSSDWVSDENKKAVHKALDIAKVKMNESISTVFSFDEFARGSAVNENKITINNDDFEKELAVQYKETLASEPLGSSGNKTESK